MQTLFRCVAVLAMVPAAANPSVISGANPVTVSLCQGGSITIPGSRPLPGSEGKSCCNKGCHGGDKRKRAGDTADGDTRDH